MIRFIKISSGWTHNAAIDSKGRLYTWGDSYNVFNKFNILKIKKKKVHQIVYVITMNLIYLILFRSK